MPAERGGYVEKAATTASSSLQGCQHSGRQLHPEKRPQRLPGPEKRREWELTGRQQ